METDRRAAALGLVLALAVLSAGCLGVLTGSEPAIFTASEAGVSESALDGTGFEAEQTETRWDNRTVEVAGQEREVRVQSHVATYRNSVSVGDDGLTFGVFAVVATPQASVAGQAMNPIGRMEPRDLVEQVAQGSNGGFSDVQREGTRTTTVLGTETDLVRFSAVAERQGQEVPVYIEVTRVRHEGDFVVAIGVYPQDSAEMESQVETLFDGLKH